VAGGKPLLSPPLASKQGASARKVTVNGTSSGAGKDEARGGDKSGLPPAT
ncbi:polycomb group RING finger protein 2, partial [Lates japonicus]